MTFAKGSIGVAVTALCLFISVEGWLTFAHPLRRFPVATIEQGELFNSINSIEKGSSDRTAQPYVVLLGSSLMVGPVVQKEALFRKQPIKRFFERRALACEDSLNHLIDSQSPDRKVRVFNAAVGGGMASDDFYVARRLLTAKAPPVALVCGVAPRDFQDNLVPGTYSTSAFQVLSNVSDLQEILPVKSMSLEQKFDILAGRVSSLWRNRTEIKTYFGLISKKGIERVCPFIMFDKYGTTLALAPQRKGIFPEEIKGTPMAFPGQAIDHFDSLKTAQQYMRSYNPVNKQMVDEQFDYFERLLKLAKKHDAKLLVVNMPLSRSNKQLIPPGFYQSYLARLNDVCKRNCVPVADFNNSQWDEDCNFIDTVHIKPEKSGEFVAELMKSVADSPLALSLAVRQKQQIGSRPFAQPQ